MLLTTEFGFLPSNSPSEKLQNYIFLKPLKHGSLSTWIGTLFSEHDVFSFLTGIWPIEMSSGDAKGWNQGGRRPVKIGERPKMFAPSDVYYFFRKIFYIVPQIFRRSTNWRWRPFFALHPGFSEGFPGNFFPKTGENELLHLRKHTSKREEIQSKFSKAGGYPPPAPGRAATGALLRGTKLLN